MRTTTTQRTELRQLLLGAAVWLAAVQSGLCFYNPSTGRWLNRDPIEDRGGANLFATLDNSLTAGVDATGKSSCKPDYQWILHPPMQDRDLQSYQTITVNTTLRIGQTSTSVSRGFSFSRLWGLTITEPSLAAVDQAILRTWRDFQVNESSDARAVDGGGGTR